jgi:hypothetical protein
MTVQFTLTEKKFARGDILRVNGVITTDEADTAARMFIDPAGTISQTDGTGLRTINSASYIDIPFRIQQ